MKRVLLLIESSRKYGRSCLQGVADHCRIHGGWHTIRVERGLVEALPKDIHTWAGQGAIDGIICRADTVQLGQAIDALGVPVVDLLGLYQPTHGAVFDVDPRAVAQLALNHFLDRGLRELAFCGYAGLAWSDQRRDHFMQLAEQHGCHVDAFDLRTPAANDDTDTVSTELLGEQIDEGLIDWLKQLPKPCGIFACNDVRARQITVACELAGVSVPEDIGIVGVDNDELICELTNPPLSSIEINARRIGQLGAQCLDQLMAKQPIDAPANLCEPQAVVTRASSDVAAISDRAIAAVLRYIRDHACDGIDVDTVARHAKMSRSSLDRRFNRVMHRTVKTEIDRVRIDRAKHLLTGTDDKIAAIAHRLAYPSPARFIEAFKRLTGTTPGQHRQNMGSR